MEDFFYQFFVGPFVELGSGFASAGTGDATWIEDIVATVDGFVWGPIMILLLLGTHIFMTFRTGFIQRKIPQGIKLSVTKDSGSGDVSPFAALTTSLAATIGTGNIIGVGTALIAGGPGAIFWMWITGVFGIATKYSETLIAVKYRVKDHNGNMLGGAMYALQRGFKRKKLGKVLGILFAVFAAIASFGIGAAVQANSLSGAIVSVSGSAGIAEANIDVFGLFMTSPLQIIVGIILVVLIAVVIVGGIKVISRVCEKLIPAMTIFYVLACLVLIIINGQYFLDAIGLIVVCAFTPQAAFGGAVGTSIMIALQLGCARGLFSNEAGMGSAPNAAATASVSHPAKQGLVQTLSVYIDTLFICTCSAMIVLVFMVQDPQTAAGLNGMPLVQMAVYHFAGDVGIAFITAAVFLFAYTSLIGNYFYAESNLKFIFGDRKMLLFWFRVACLAIIFAGCLSNFDLAWNVADI